VPATNSYISAARQATRPAESGDRYPVVAILNERFRVIRCRDGIQWVLQHRNVAAGTGGNRPETISTGDWRGRSYPRTREALIRCCCEHAGDINPVAVVALLALPERVKAPAGGFLISGGAGPPGIEIGANYYNENGGTAGTANDLRKGRGPKTAAAAVRP
jgi:hypothetical protein